MKILKGIEKLAVDANPILSAIIGGNARQVFLYTDKMRQAKNMIAKKDPDDAHLLALAIELNCPIWSNDRDFEGLKIKLYTTLDLIAE